MTAVGVVYVLAGGAIALPLAATAVYWARRALLDAWDARHETPYSVADDELFRPSALYPPLPDDTDVMPAVTRTDLVPLSVADRVRAVFAEPSADWWLVSYSPPPSVMQPALIGDAMTVLRVSPEWTVQPRDGVTA